MTDANTLREVVAGIVDPDANFQDIEGVCWSRAILDRRELAYRKANAILALIPARAGPAATPARGFIQEHLERSLSEYDKTIDRATDDGALSETGREMIFQSCRVSKSAIRAFAERLQTYAALAAPQAQEDGK